VAEALRQACGQRVGGDEGRPLFELAATVDVTILGDDERAAL